MNIADPSKDNVVLLPKTVDYYQMELTRMLETERYGQAMELLRFLLRCQTDDERSRDEWGSLLDWLSTMFPDHADGTRPDAGEWEEEETENDLRRNHVLQKAAADRAYADKLLEALRQPVSPEKQFMALEQLVYVDHPGINEQLTRHLAQTDLHPFVQFKILQTLKRRGATGSLTFSRNGERLNLDVEDVPLEMDQYPANITGVMSRLQDRSEISHPELAYFAEELWKEFLAFIYGTSIYYQLVNLDSEQVDSWAAALHTVLLEIMMGQADQEEVKDIYGITDRLLMVYSQAYRVLKNFTVLVYRNAEN